MSEKIQNKSNKKTHRPPAKGLSDDWFLLEPYGLSLGAMEAPLFLFKEVEGDRVLPVRMSPTDTAVTISQSHMDKDSFTHRVSKKILNQLGWSLKFCYFSEVKGQHQYLKLYFGTEKDDAVEVIEARADESLSFCLQWNCPFYCDDNFLEESRVSDAALDEDFLSEDGLEKPMYLN